MSEEKLLTIRDVSLVMGISEKEVMDMAQRGVLPAYKIGGVYLRFKRHEVEAYKKKTFSATHKTVQTARYSFLDRVSDFFYFNDFYIISILIIAAILLIIFRGY